MKQTIKLAAFISGLIAVTATAHAHSSLLPANSGLTTPPSIQKAQFKLPFGMNARRVRSMLQRDGYDEIDITYLGIIDAKADVCRKGTRYRVKIRANGSYEYRKDIGKCRRAIAANDVRGILRKDGFRSIDIARDGRIPYQATGCRNGNRFSLEVGEFGKVRVIDRISKCGPDLLSPRQVRQALRKDGFDRIKFTDRTPPRYVIEACRNTRKIRLNIDRRGRIRDRERIGRCAARIKPDEIAGILERNGFNRIDVVDDKPPRYRAEACRGNDRVRIAISPWGDRVNERRIGECAPPVTVASLTEQLKKHPKKFRSIKVREGERYPFVANVCNEGRKQDLFFSRYGKYEGNRDLGKCVSLRLDQIVDRFDRLRNVETFIEGCTRRGRRVRIKIDTYGEVIDRERIGRC